MKTGKLRLSFSEINHEMTKFTANAKRFVHYYQKMNFASNFQKSFRKVERKFDFFGKMITKYMEG